MDKKISQMPLAGALNGTETLHIVQNGVSKKISPPALLQGTALAADPIKRTDGTALQLGDEYFNTINNRKKIFRSTGWVDYEFSSAANATLSQTSSQVATTQAGISTTQAGISTTQATNATTSAKSAKNSEILSRKSIKQLQSGIIIPLYQYPANVYTNPVINNLIRLIRTYQNVPVIVIVNPNSGPGTVVDLNYAALLLRLRGAGAIVSAYVATTYSVRPFEAIVSDIQLWKTLYPSITSIFLDESSNTVGQEAGYLRIKNYCHENSFYPVVSNPGAGLPQSYFDQDTSDIYVTYENLGYPSEALISGDYGGGYADYEYKHRSVMVYGAAYDKSQLNLLRKHFGWIYLSDIGMPNPYINLPSYLEILFKDLSYPNDQKLSNKAINWNPIAVNTPLSIAHSYSGITATVPITVSIDTTNDSGIEIGTFIEFYAKGGSITFTSTVGVTITVIAGKTTVIGPVSARGRLDKVAAGEWTLTGNLV